MPSPHSTPLPPAFPPISEPANDLSSLRATVMQLKEAIELLTGQRASRGTTEYSVQGALSQIEDLGSRIIELSEIGPGLARRVDIVEARSDEFSAQGQVVISAEANPTGYKAYFGVYLRAVADSVPGTLRGAGFHIGLTNADGAVTTIETTKFYLRDPSSGVAATVFSYSGGLFEFTGNMKINGNLLVNNTFTAAKYGDLSMLTGKINYNAVTTMFQSAISGFYQQNSMAYTTAGSVGITAPAGASAVLSVGFSGNGINVPSGTSGFTGAWSWRVVDDYGNTWISGGSLLTFAQKLMVTVPASNNYYFQVQITSNGLAGYYQLSVNGFIEVIVNKR